MPVWRLGLRWRKVPLRDRSLLAMSTTVARGFFALTAASIALIAAGRNRPAAAETVPKPRRRFSSSDFAVVCPGVTHLPRTSVAPGIEKVLDRHRIETDEHYLRRPPRELIEKAAPFLAEQAGTLDRLPGQEGFSSVALNDERFYIAHTGSPKGFGLYAARPVPSGTVVGVYTGFLNDRQTSDYRWNYQSKPIAVQTELGKPAPEIGIHTKEGSAMELGVDAENGGNVLRFINHDDKPSCDAWYMPWENKWHVVYVTNREIPADEEISVSYGWPFHEEPRTSFD